MAPLMPEQAGTHHGNPRLRAAALLQDIVQDRASLGVLAQSGEDPDSALVQELCYGVCRHYHELLALAARYLKKALRNKDLDVLCLILLGLYQLFYLRIPAHAAINETVSCVRKTWARGLVNAVLRSAQREFPDYSASVHEDESARFSHPPWLLEALKRDWPDHYPDIMQANNARAPMTLRVNLSRLSREDYLQHLQDAGIQAGAGRLASTSIVLDKPCPVQALPGFEEGLVSVQDEASQLVIPLLQLSPGLTVLDACAAPGGKTCAMLEAVEGLDVLALDNDPQRLQRVADNLARLDLQARLDCRDARTAFTDTNRFDRILLDAPCSATGVIRRHPDIKLLRSPEQVAELKVRQQAILAAVWPALKPGGLLLYSTCSLLLDENSRQIAAFLQKTPDACALPLDVPWGQALETGRQLLPGEYNQDGFYYALLQKC